MSLLAIDIGSGLVKVASDDSMFYFESLVGVQKEVGDFSFNVPAHQIIRANGKQYLTGAAAKSYIPNAELVVTTKSTWCQDNNQLYLLYSAIAKAYPNGFAGEMVLISGLPMARFTKYQGIHKALFVGNHVFSTPSSDYNVTIQPNAVEVFPQAVGLYFSLLETQTDQNWNEGQTGLIDPGTHTTGYAVIDKGSYNNLKSANEKSKGASAGMMKLAKEMRGELAEQYDWHPEIPELLEALRVGHVELLGEKPQRIILKDIAQRYVPTVYGDVVEEIVEKWDRAKAIRTIISSGGGAYIIDYVRKFIPHAQLLHKTRTAKDKMNDKALYDVVRGYRIFGNEKFKTLLQSINQDVVKPLNSNDSLSKQKAG